MYIAKSWHFVWLEARFTVSILWWVRSFFVWRFQFNVSCISRFSSISYCSNMKVRVFKSLSSLQDESKRLLWLYNNSLASILTISSSLGSLLEYRASPSRAEKRRSYVPQFRNKRLWNAISLHVYANLKFTTVSHGECWRHISGHPMFSVNADLKLSIREF